MSANPLDCSMINQIRLHIFSFLLGGLLSQASAQSINYQEIFGQDWKNAESFVSENKQWMKFALDKYNIPFDLAIAVIFPELVRYSALRDKIEITLLKALYINLGAPSANFSVGHFQMKPSFAEKVRDMAQSVLGRRSGNFFKDKSGYTDSISYRASIVADLEDPRMQLNYLIVFLMICNNRFHLKEMDDSSKLIFLATAYNSGFYRSEKAIIQMENKKFFNSKLFASESYSYADISLYWYKLSKKAR
jgi:hypothetical protein